MGRELTQPSGDRIASSSCPLVLIKGKAAARTAVFPHLPAVGAPPSPKALTVGAVTGTTRRTAWGYSR